jgi:hypothetical protein
MIDTTKYRYAEDLHVGDELDLDGDEYGDNENAIFGYAKVLRLKDSYTKGEPCILLVTTQGIFTVPAGHRMKVRVSE